jgi:hypothetical protein
MSPPEVWGPAVWILFHTLIEKMNPYAYPHVIGSMFGMIVRICKVLPCPECSVDASNFLAKIKLNDYKTKDQFKNMLYLFHNWVNAKKRKPLYNYSHLQKYDEFNLILVMNNFISKYNTKGNMKLLADSFQRNFVVKDLVSWFKIYARAFIQQTIINYPKQAIKEQTIIEEPSIKEESVSEDEIPTTKQEETTKIQEETTKIQEETISTIKDECINEDIESLEIHSNENIKIEEVYTDILEEQVIIREPKKKRNGKKKK